MEKVEIVEISSLASDKNNPYQFMHTFLCHPTPFRPNTLIKFRLANIFKPLLTTSSSPLRSSAWAGLFL